MIVRRADKRPRELQPGVTHAVLSYGDALMLCEVTIDKGVTFPEHSHPHAQTVYVITGSVRFSLGEEVHELDAGDSCFIEPDVVHGLTALTDTRVLDAFSPLRHDFLPFAPSA
ncbi:MAG: cupin domain-containing protein [Anaerolineae bacterium]